MPDLKGDGGGDGGGGGWWAGGGGGVGVGWGGSQVFNILKVADLTDLRGDEWYVGSLC